jgi:hypothetical protein
MIEETPRVVGAMAIGGESRADEEATHRSTLATGRWHTLSLMEQLGNVGSEVERAFRGYEQGRANRFEPALARALELFDLTANDPRWRGHRCREVLRAREQFCRVFFDEAVEPGLADYLRKYFLQFAVAARAQGK